MPSHPAKPIAALLLLAATLLLLSACGDDGETTVTETVTSTPTEATQETTEETTSESESGEEGPPPADREVTELTGFTSPSGNIGCYIDQMSVRCDISERDWQPPKAPKSCKLDYGQGIELRAGAGADFVCAGDTALGGGDELPYGESIGAGLLRCESAEAGITCTDTENGRGFSIAKESYEIF